MDKFAFQTELIAWRGPSPFVFAPIPALHTQAIRVAAKRASYGWGVIPVEAMIDGVLFTTSLFPKDEAYLLPIKVAVRQALNVTVGDVIDVELRVVARQ